MVNTSHQQKWHLKHLVYLVTQSDENKAYLLNTVESEILLSKSWIEVAITYSVVWLAYYITITILLYHTLAYYHSLGLIPAMSKKNLALI